MSFLPEDPRGDAADCGDDPDYPFDIEIAGVEAVRNPSNR